MTFRNVSIVLYDADREPMTRVAVEPFSTDETVAPIARNVTLTADHQPRYVVLTGADLWPEKANVVVYAYRYDGGQFDRYVRYSQDQVFPRAE